MNININFDTEMLRVAVIAFFVGIITQMVIDYASTPTVEETAQWKVEQEVEMQMMIEMAKIYRDRN
jgi:hypothetical protein